MTDHPLWSPHADRVTAMQAFASARACDDYAALHAWSIREPAAFWRAVWDACEVIGDAGEVAVEHEGSMPAARWFPQARLNFAENLLRDSTNPEALVFIGEKGDEQRVSRAALRRAVAQVGAALRAEGVQAGDRIAAWLPNLPETIIVMLAAASIGAVFSSASPDFGVQGVLDRFGQITPSVLFASEAYAYNGRVIDLRERLAAVAAGLPGVRIVRVAHLRDALPPSEMTLPGVDWAAFVAPHAQESEPRFERLPFAHPLYILYSSGTTGLPKCIVHGAGGSLLQHLKEHRLHSDIAEGDRLFYFTTCGWMMWNWLASALASGATLLLFDGSPFCEGGRRLWAYAQDERCTHFGTSAKYLDALSKSGLRPRDEFRLDALRVLLSTGSPLAPEGFDFVRDSIGAEVQTASISGGTDILGCFVLGNPAQPVWRGEIQCAGLGMAVEVWREDGTQAAIGERGELVCTHPFPSMPLGFWNDADGARYRAAYFERFAGVWCHGDWCERTPHGGYVIHGRSDATLNPGGVRIGTAEIYRQVERLDEVLESLAVGQDWQGDVRIVLFVRLRDALTLDAALEARIRNTIREHTSPRHVPAKIVQVVDIPRTRSGKTVELAVRQVLHGQVVKNSEALANPEALEWFRDRPELRT